MSTYRYTWNKYTVASVAKPTTKSTTWQPDLFHGNYNYAKSLSLGAVNESGTYPSFSFCEWTHSTANLSDGDNTIPAGTYFGSGFYINYDDPDAGDHDGTEYGFWAAKSSLGESTIQSMHDSGAVPWSTYYGADSYFLFYAVSNVTVNYDSANETLGISGSLALVYVDVTTGQGSYVGSVTAVSSGAYPSGGESGGYWYVYAGAYTLEPSSVALTAAPTAGESATISVSGGRSGVTYTYGYSLDGGATWVTLGASSATTYSFTVPTGTKSLTVRVIPSDSLGTGSAVVSATYTDFGAPAYVGIGGVVYEASLRVCAGGVIYDDVSPCYGIGGSVETS